MRNPTARLLLAASVCLAHPIAVRAQAPAPSYRYAGFVTDSIGNPVGYAEVRVTPVKNSVHETRADAGGHFVLTALPDGAAQMNVRRLGYHPFNGTITIGKESPDSARIMLFVASAELAAIEVREESLADSLAPKEFSIRKRTNHFGRYLDINDIEDKHVSYASELFRGMPGVTLQRTSRLGMILRIRGCRPTLWVDGVRAGGAEVDELVAIPELAAVEVYNSLAGMPPQYMDRNNPCGGILFWTRSR